MSKKDLREKFISNAQQNGWSIKFINETQTHVEMRKSLSSLQNNEIDNKIIYGDDSISIPELFLKLLEGLENAMQYELCR